MPTLLDLADIQIPETCTGISMIKDLKEKRFTVNHKKGSQQHV